MENPMKVMKVDVLGVPLLQETFIWKRYETGKDWWIRGHPRLSSNPRNPWLENVLTHHRSKASRGGSIGNQIDFPHFQISDSCKESWDFRVCSIPSCKPSDSYVGKMTDGQIID